jgi:YfiH family protein
MPGGSQAGSRGAAPSWLVPDWPGLPANIGALTTTRLGGVSPAPYDDGQGGGGFNLGVHVGDAAENVRHNRRLLRAALPAEPYWLTQVHGTVVADAGAAAVPHPAAEAAVAAGQLVHAAPEADAAYARVPGAVCTIMTADCLPVLFCDRAGSVVGAAHAGWRGLAGGVLARTLDAMRAAGAGEIMAWLGPAIGPSQFEVGADVLQAFEAGARDAAALREVTAAFRAIEGRPGKYLADIYALARSVLRRDGVARIAGGEFCTVSDGARFYSYRRDKVTGRQASLIWIK